MRIGYIDSEDFANDIAADVGAVPTTYTASQTYSVAPTAVSYEVLGTQVVSARQTGWTAATGTAQRSGYSTYTSPTISTTYTQVEVQAIADALQAVSRTLKALVDDLTTHGLIGT